MITFMTNIYLIGLSGLWKSFYMFSLIKVSLGVSLLLWQQLCFPSGLLRFCRTCQTVPYLMLELRMRLNMRYWVSWLSLSMVQANTCQTHSFTISHHDYLASRDGRRIFDFLKTLSIADVSPPAFS